MKKDRLITLGLCFIVTFLTCWLFWETIGKSYIETFIKQEYGNRIEQTYNNSELIKELLNINEDDT